jgi:hypothetical protein
MLLLLTKSLGLEWAEVVEELEMRQNNMLFSDDR